MSMKKIFNYSPNFDSKDPLSYEPIIDGVNDSHYLTTGGAWPCEFGAHRSTVVVPASEVLVVLLRSRFA